MYKNRIQLDVTVGNSQDMFNYISNGVIPGGKLSICTDCLRDAMLLKSNELSIR